MKDKRTVHYFLRERQVSMHPISKSGSDQCTVIKTFLQFLPEGPQSFAVKVIFVKNIFWAY
jgi:hypothetical protein